MKGFGDKKNSKNYKENKLELNLNKEKILNNALKYHAKGDVTEALKYYQYYIDQGFNNHIVFSNYAVILKDLGKLKEAEILLRKAIELNPQYVIAYSNLAGILINLGKLQEAESLLRKAIKLKPDNAVSYSNLGGILGDLGKLQEAESLLLKAIKLNPDYTKSYSNLGIILRDLGRLKEAESYHRKAIALNPDLHEGYIELAIDLYILGKKNLAIKSLLKASLLDSKNITGQILLSVFQNEQKNKAQDHQQNNCKSNISKNNHESNLLIFNIPVPEKLIDSLYKIKTREQDIYQFPTYGDSKGSDYKLFESNDLNIKIIKKKLIKVLKSSLNSEIFISESFFTIFRSGGGLISHDHLSKIDKTRGLNIAHKKFSLVYYLSVGDQNCQKPGILKLENPNQEILPKKGMVIIFPAERKHSVFYKGNKDRIIIGVNFYKI